MKSAEDLLKERMAARKAAAIMVANNPSKFKICEGCESILLDIVDVCPVCSAYRFNKNPLDLLKQAEALANRDSNQLSAADYGFE